MVVRHSAVHDQYCELPKSVADAFLNAPSMGQYFKTNIAASGKSGRYDCGAHKAS
jgi:hypothetical protein